jgi:hypothetical protein
MPNSTAFNDFMSLLLAQESHRTAGLPRAPEPQAKQRRPITPNGTSLGGARQGYA